DAGAVASFARDFQAETYPNVEALCASPHVDVIYIATPTQYHTEHVLLALEHGKHVVIEKPMALNLDDADRMIQAAEARGRQLVVGHSHSFEPPIRKIREIAQSGALGRVRMLHNWCFTHSLYPPPNTAHPATPLAPAPP